MAAAESHPRSALLVVEVSGESLAQDRSLKARVYARAGVPEYWIVNVVERCVEVHREPDATAGGYGRIERMAAGERLSTEDLPSFTLDISSLFD